MAHDHLAVAPPGRSDLESLLVIGNRPRQVPRDLQRKAPIGERQCESRFELDRSTVVLDRFIYISIRVPRSAPVEVVKGISRRDLDCLIVVLNGSG